MDSLLHGKSLGPPSAPSKRDNLHIEEANCARQKARKILPPNFLITSRIDLDGNEGVAGQNIQHGIAEPPAQSSMSLALPSAPSPIKEANCARQLVKKKILPPKDQST